MHIYRKNMSIMVVENFVFSWKSFQRCQGTRVDILGEQRLDPPGACCFRLNNSSWAVAPGPNHFLRVIGLAQT